MTMFKGKKSSVFWAGLLILGLASVILFSLLWFTMVLGPPTNIDYYWKILTPPILGSVVFILIGLYMMKSGTKTEEEGKTQLLSQ
jgi:putative Mn2+ efflux pump MntP